MTVDQTAKTQCNVFPNLPRRQFSDNRPYSINVSG